MVIIKTLLYPLVYKKKTQALVTKKVESNKSVMNIHPTSGRQCNICLVRPEKVKKQ